MAHAPKAKEEKVEELKRDIGLYGSFCMGYADVGANVYIILGIVAAYAAGAAPLAFLVAAVAYVCIGFAYAELGSVYPYAGGAQVYSMKAFNDLVGFVAGWSIMLSYTVCIALFAMATSGYLSFFFPALKSATIPALGLSVPALTAVTFALIFFLMGVNLIGVKAASRLNETLVAVGLVVTSLIIVLGLLFSFSIPKFLSQIGIFGSLEKISGMSYALPGNFQFQNFIYGIALAMASFIGIESIAQAAEETRRPARIIPKANMLAIASVIIFAVGISAISMGIVDWNDLAASKEYPIAFLAEKIGVVGELFVPVVALTGFLLCLVSTNTGVIGASRVVFSMGRFRMMPPWFYKVHPRFKTPYRTILVFGTIGALMTLLGDLSAVASLYAFGALLSYTLVNISLIVLRNKESGAYRAWKVPFNLRIGKLATIPLTGVLGALLCVGTWIVLVSYYPAGRLLGFAWIAAGVVMFAVYRGRSGLPLMSDAEGRKIIPESYEMNALVLLRTPENEEAVVESLKHSIDHRYRITLLSIMDAREIAPSLEDVNVYAQMKRYSGLVREELDSIAGRLRREGFRCLVRVRIGDTDMIIEDEALSDENDAIVMLRKKSIVRGEKGRDIASIVTNAAPGKLILIREGRKL